MVALAIIEDDEVDPDRVLAGRLARVAVREIGVEGVALRLGVGRWRVRGWLAGTSWPEGEHRRALEALAAVLRWDLDEDPEGAFGETPVPLDHRIAKVPPATRRMAHGRANPMVQAKLVARGDPILPPDPVPRNAAERVRESFRWRSQVRDAVRFLAAKHGYAKLARATGVKEGAVSAWVCGRNSPYAGRAAILVLWARAEGFDIPPVVLRPIVTKPPKATRWCIKPRAESVVFREQLSAVVGERHAARLASKRRSLARLIAASKC
jgi:transcriptional regulator with XRE-family HTH domain